MEKSVEQEIIYLKTMAIWNRLKEYVNAGIRVRVDEDSLIISFKNDDIIKEYIYDNFWDEFVLTEYMSTDKVVADVVKKYRKEILSRYFY